MFKNILIVCVGNICRSPMAQALLKHSLTEHNKHEYEVVSAGLGALVGKPPDEIACKLMLNKGIDISTQHACQINKEMIRNSDLILVMEHSHKNAIRQIDPPSLGKVFLLGEWEEGEIPDPYQKEIEYFQNALALIETAVLKWVKKL